MHKILGEKFILPEVTHRFGNNKELEVGKMVMHVLRSIGYIIFYLIMGPSMFEMIKYMVS